MARIQKNARRRIVPPEADRYVVQSSLLRVLRADARYQRVTGIDLREHYWRPVMDSEASSAYLRRSPWEAMRRPGPFPWNPQSPDSCLYHDYLAALGLTVRETLGLRDARNGMPPRWAVDAVHEDVVRKDMAREYVIRKNTARYGGNPANPPRVALPPPTLESPAFELRISANGVEVRRGPDSLGRERSCWDPAPLDDPWRPVYVANEAGLAGGITGQHLDFIGEVAETVIQEMIAAIGSELEEQYGTKNTASVDRQEPDITMLVRWLFHGHGPMGPGDVQRMRRLCGRLGIQMPQRPKAKRRSRPRS